MGNYLPPDACVSEIDIFKAASKAFDEALDEYNDAEDNMIGAGLSTGGAAVTTLACTFAATGVGAVICLVGAGSATLGGLFWTRSAGGGVISAQKDLEKAMADLDSAIDKACKCIEQNMVCVPD